MPINSLDVSLTGIVTPTPIDANVDERKPAYFTDPGCPSNLPAYASHGTHTSGLVGANGDAGFGVQGTCQHCGVAMWKVAYAVCNLQVHQVRLNYNPMANATALTYIGDGGAQVASMSFGGDRIPNYCSTLAGGATPADPADTPMCLAITHQKNRDVVMVAASGNARKRLQFPANDDRVIAAGGFQPNLALWDESPGNNVHCPTGVTAGTECGSNYTVPATTGAQQELMASAKSVLSTTYPGYDWNPDLDCGDHFPGPGAGNGVGDCTGTSMSSPQIAGVAGLVRSINPLVPTGQPTYNPQTGKPTLRWVLASTTAEAENNQGFTPTFGYGHPDAATAARKMLGKVAGATVRNRATPLFRLYRSTAPIDYADTVSPQTAVALMFNTKNNWQPASNAALVPNYPILPHGTDDGTLAAPRAAVYVMTTEYRPRNEWPALRPLYLMDKDSANGQIADFMLVTTASDIEYAHNHGYNLRTIQGYIYQPCTPEPRCIPPAAQRFYRACSAAGDCATFLESEAANFAGYNTTFPPIGGTRTLLGYAYPATDSDGDGLPDGFEYVIGSDPTSPWSNGNHSSTDAQRFPMVGVSLIDPCAGGLYGSSHCGAEDLFHNGFDFP